MQNTPMSRYGDIVNVTSPGAEWPDSLLRDYGQMMSVRDVALALNIEESNVRALLTATHPAGRMPGVKLGKSWRIDRGQLRAFLLAHHNDRLLSSAHIRETNHV